MTGVVAKIGPDYGYLRVRVPDSQLSFMVKFTLEDIEMEDGGRKGNRSLPYLARQGSSWSGWYFEKKYSEIRRRAIRLFNCTEPADTRHTLSAHCLSLNRFLLVVAVCRRK